MTGFTTRIPIIAAILVAVLMVISLAWQGWGLFDAEERRQTRSNAGAGPASSTATVARNDKALAAVNLFGDSQAQGQPDQQNTENLPETNLRLVLRGVMAGEANSIASALIEDSNNQTEAYLIDDELPGNATLKSVYPNRIIIERSGALENLYFPQAKKGEGIRVSSSSQASGPERSEPAQQPRAQRQQSQRTPPTSSSRQEEIRNRLEELRERLRNNSN
jgi:general secretion pathway protein C